MKFPNAWAVTAKAEKAEPKKLESRIDMSAEVAGQGLCPECKVPMEEVYAGGRPMWACAKDRITLPRPNDQQD